MESPVKTLQNEFKVTFQVVHGGEPWSHFDGTTTCPPISGSFNSATAVSRGVTVGLDDTINN